MKDRWVEDEKKRTERKKERQRKRYKESKGER